MDPVQLNEQRLSCDSGIASDLSPTLNLKAVENPITGTADKPSTMDRQAPIRKTRKKPPALPEIKSYPVLYLGNLMLDRRYTQPMLPWVMSEIRRKHIMKPIRLQVLSRTLRAVADNDTIDPRDPSEIVFEHKLTTLTRFARTHEDLTCFAYLTRTNTDSPFCCFVFQAYSADKVKELFNAIRQATKEVVNDTQKDRPAVEMKPGSQFYEVMYTGKVIVAHKKVPANFLDDSVDKFLSFDHEKRNKLQGKQTVDEETRQRHGSGASIHSLPGNLENSVSIKENELSAQVPSNSGECIQGFSTTSSSCSEDNLDSSVETLDNSNFISKSDDSLEKKIETSVTDDGKMGKDVENLKKSMSKDTRNKTMILQITMTDLGFISLDKKGVILERKFKDISFCSQGTCHPEHFGFITRDAHTKKFTLYIFRCATESVVTEIMQSLKQAFQNAFQQNAKNHVVCEQCPMHQLHKLCQEIDGMPSQRVYEIINSRIEGLQERDLNEVMFKLKSENPQTHQEMNEVIMIQLRILCELRQKEHSHISDANKTETANIFNLTGVKTSKFDMLKSKAKKSLATSFETLFTSKKKDEQNATKGRSWTTDSEINLGLDLQGITPDPSPCTSPIAKNFHELHDLFPELEESPRGLPPLRPRSSTVGDTPHEQRRSLQSGNIDIKLGNGEDSSNKPRISSARRGSKLYMLAKASETGQESSSREATQHSTEELHDNGAPFSAVKSTTGRTPRRRPSWRQAIFNRVVTPVRVPNSRSFRESSDSAHMVGKLHTSESIRALWRKAILETRLLIRMEKENQNLQAHQDEVEDFRLKLDYEEITPCLKDVSQTWDSMLSSPGRKNIKFDRESLITCVRAGVPRRKRAEIWEFAVEQHRLYNPGAQKPTTKIDLFVKYHDLLKQLTTHQHAILIDLGRTFPSHPYFSGQAGSGQLALFNLLKAYSLLDKEVGYCQGLSFVAGFLLMHLPEERSFALLKYLMFQLGFRRQFRPDMVALQIQMYQLSRLLHDKHKDLYEHFENHEIVPTLYAAPWFLTLYASQFPLGFVARVFDLLFVFGIEIIFKVAVILLGNHKELIMHCDSFETIVEFLKTTLPEMGIIQMERVFNQVFTLDIAQELKAYEVEYHVLQEEMISSPQKGDDDLLQKLELANHNLKRQNMELIEQLRTSHNQNNSYEHTIQGLQANDNKLRQHIRTLELERSALLNTVTKLKKLIPSEILAETLIEIPPLSPSFDTLSKFSGTTGVKRISSSDKITDMERKQCRTGSAEETDLEVATFTIRNTVGPSRQGDGFNSNEQKFRNKNVATLKQQPDRPLSNPK